MSLIDDLVNLLRLKVEVYHNARVCGDWHLEAEATNRACFHMPSQGECRLQVPGEGEWHLHQGDVAIFPRELAHSIVPTEPLSGQQQHLPIAQSQGQPGTSLLCGVIHFHHSGGAQLVGLLPKVVVVRMAEAGQWLKPLSELIVHESLAGEELNSPVLARLCEVLVSYTLRCHIQNSSHPTGLLAVYNHPRLFKAVKAMHSRPGRDWQLASLAEQANMSRSRFAQLFSEVAGMTATQYLVWWRMQVAFAELKKGHSVEQVADAVGYASEAAFARVFKKTMGTTVGAVRAGGNATTG
ncbi:AraC family transcriptional regulator [Halioxenophilus aromaticivorans]|uniref:AraC family transcriptional regulator n=1 Tax=Halioxenophilus aromaticivorans TaxID=1306992 RepID=A0AAV3U6K4_9ALTE